MRKTSAMVEAGILAAIAVVMALIAMYVPVIGAFVNFVWPLPIIICGMRHGFKYSVMTLIVATIIVAIVISPIQAFFLGAIFGLLGLILGECMRRHLSAAKIMLYGSVGAVIALILNIVLSFAFLDIDPIAMMFSQFDKSLTDMADFYRNHGISEADTQAAVQNYSEMLKMMRIIMPGAFLLSAPMLAFVNYFVAKKVLSRLGESFDDLPPFVNWIVPTWVLAPFILSLVGVTYFYINKLTDTWMYKLCVNVQTVCTFLLVLQAICLIYWYVKEKNKPKWWANVFTALIFVVPILSQIMVYVGAFDMIADYRKIRKEYPEIKTKKK
ncbi:MAG: YybS family protein [Phascolarctobacterium sp.]|nr:YybS family protein [Phascolarctobacterium sp.]